MVPAPRGPVPHSPRHHPQATLGTGWPASTKHLRSYFFTNFKARASWQPQDLRGNSHLKWYLSATQKTSLFIINLLCEKQKYISSTKHAVSLGILQ